MVLAFLVVMVFASYECLAFVFRIPAWQLCRTTESIVPLMRRDGHLAVLPAEHNYGLVWEIYFQALQIRLPTRLIRHSICCQEPQLIQTGPMLSFPGATRLRSMVGRQWIFIGAWMGESHA
jgi:hypothetical protein